MKTTFARLMAEGLYCMVIGALDWWVALIVTSGASCGGVTIGRFITTAVRKPFALLNSSLMLSVRGCVGEKFS